MDIYEDQVIPAQPEKVVNQFVKTVCDLCKGDMDPEGTFTSRTYTEVSITEVDEYDHGLDDTFSVDVCTSCFRNKLIPWLVPQEDG